LAVGVVFEAGRTLVDATCFAETAGLDVAAAFEAVGFLALDARIAEVAGVAGSLAPARPLATGRERASPFDGLALAARRAAGRDFDMWRAIVALFGRDEDGWRLTGFFKIHYLFRQVPVEILSMSAGSGGRRGADSPYRVSGEARGRGWRHPREPS
jgi:hypothetical protein